MVQLFPGHNWIYQFAQPLYFDYPARTGIAACFRKSN